MDLNHFDSFLQMENLTLKLLNEYIKPLISSILIPTIYNETKIKVYALLIPMNCFSSGGAALSIKKKMAQLSASTGGGELILSQLDTIPIFFSSSTDEEALQAFSNTSDTHHVRWQKSILSSLRNYWPELLYAAAANYSLRPVRYCLLTIGAVTLLVL